MPAKGKRREEHRNEREHDVSRADVHVHDGHVLSLRAHSRRQVKHIDLFRKRAAARAVVLFVICFPTNVRRDPGCLEGKMRNGSCAFSFPSC